MDVMDGVTVNEDGDYVIEITSESMLESAKRLGYSAAQIEAWRLFLDADPASRLH